MTDTDRGRSRDRESAFYLFTQQWLPACKPVLSLAWVILIFLFIGFIFIPVGLVTLQASHSVIAHSLALVVEIVEQYDIGCVPKPFRINKVSYIQDDSIPKNCALFFVEHRSLLSCISLFFRNTYFASNISLYIKSRSDQQLLRGRKYHDTISYHPVEFSNDQHILPCGLIAWSLFNDTFTFIRDREELKVNRKNIARKSDREHKFGKNVYPFNFQNGTVIGGGKLNPRIPLSDQEDLIVWMRTSALPSFRKLYGRIETDLDVDDVVVKLVLSTTSWLGRKNDFLGLAYVFIGSSSVTVAVVITLLHLLSPR
ncbi:hypothetical protein ERO13_A10G042950v2 [Gossypium hirsutum]|nr:hypothetical protein ERO13_A10G042950v2 [Gossypium hirsutum]